MLNFMFQNLGIAEKNQFEYEWWKYESRYSYDKYVSKTLFLARYSSK